MACWQAPDFLKFLMGQSIYLTSYIHIMLYDVIPYRATPTITNDHKVDQ